MKYVGKNKGRFETIKNGIAAIIITILVIGTVGCASKENTTDKNITTQATTTTNVSNESSSENTTIKEDTTKEENTTQVQTTKQETTTIKPTEKETTTKQETTTQKETTTKAPAPTTTAKKQDPTVNVTTSKKPEVATDPITQESTTNWEIETFPSKEIETHPNPSKFDYTEGETLDIEDLDKPVWWYDEPIYPELLADEIRFKTANAKYALNYSLENCDDFNKFVLEAIIQYCETHDDECFYMINVDSQTAEDWKKICATWLYTNIQPGILEDGSPFPIGETLFDWKLVTQRQRLLNNFLWDTIYNDDFSKITDMEVVEFYNEDHELFIFEKNKNGTTNKECYFKISFKSGGADYLAWFGAGGGNGHYRLLDIDRLD